MKTKKQEHKEDMGEFRDALLHSMSSAHAINSFFSKGKCPYLPGCESISYAFSVKAMEPAKYEQLIDKGFRRNGFYFYKNLCPGCRACIPLRVDVRNFRLSKSQRRVLMKNQDVTIERHPVRFEMEGFLLYRKYCHERHDAAETEKDYLRFLIDTPVHTEMMRYYVGNQLMGIGWIDMLPRSLSSVYFVFDPDMSARSPGVFSLLKEIALCKELDKEWLQLGFWIRENHKMSYKSKYKPCHILKGGVWQEPGNK